MKNTPNTSSCHYGGISPAAGLTNSSILLPTRVYQVERHEERYDLLPNKVDWENEDEAGVSQKESEQDTYIFGLGTFLSCQPPPGEQQLVWELKMARLSMMQSLRNSPELSDELTSLSDEQVSTTRGSEEKLFCGAGALPVPTRAQLGAARLNRPCFVSGHPQLSQRSSTHSITLGAGA